MPEVIEVNFLKDEIASTFIGKKVVEAILNNEKISNVCKNEFEKELKDEVLKDVARHGKVLILKFSNYKYLLIHFLLTGYLRLIDDSEKEKAQAYLKFDNGKSIGIFGIMSNGFIHLHETKNINNLDEIKELGIDVLDEKFTLENFKKIILKNGTKRIKDILLDQSIIAGLGNAYSDEILFVSKVNPKRKGGYLSEDEIESIYKNIFFVLEKSKKYGGASELSFVHLDGSKGHFHEHFLVHKREGEKCPICGTPIETTKIGGRTSYFCPKCQR
ncbi:Fpg/Nei family DNA glycosylase [Caldisericum exile]|uniref:Formamidopyrimidine-DNA glycosylase/AP lyase n=1 Tax=Caldisericum exile (strain DSM 21853 / NBRC 104410 / AZM16c01) TaxID=511051 RepID=A0A7U6GEL2_CALEA|nr:DNA-formamidopyrimidine glycosylase family protein [Caldisericum exile]BAL80969.1 formamidopyrimidine-DNA glycosylase/AP lyase [Caldisericum exile AZM16c01]